MSGDLQAVLKKLRFVSNTFNNIVLMIRIYDSVFLLIFFLEIATEASSKCPYCINIV